MHKLLRGRDADAFTTLRPAAHHHDDLRQNHHHRSSLWVPHLDRVRRPAVERELAHGRAAPDNDASATARIRHHSSRSVPSRTRRRTGRQLLATGVRVPEVHQPESVRQRHASGNRWWVPRGVRHQGCVPRSIESTGGICHLRRNGLIRRGDPSRDIEPNLFDGLLHTALSHHWGGRYANQPAHTCAWVLARRYAGRASLEPDGGM